MTKNDNLPALAALIGGLLLVMSPIDIDGFNFDFGGINNRPKTVLARQIADVAPEGSKEHLCQMSESTRALANFLSTNPKIRAEEGFDDDPGKVLKEVLELSYVKGFNFQEEYPEVERVISKWFDLNIRDDMTSEDLIKRLHELADALK